MTIAHIGGLPLEETVQMLAPAGAATITMTIAWLRRR
jgi:hypothetical protein